MIEFTVGLLVGGSAGGALSGWWVIRRIPRILARMSAEQLDALAATVTEERYLGTD